MTLEQRLFLIVLIINFFIILCYVTWHCLVRRNSSKSMWIRVTVMFFCPVVGSGFFLLSFLFFKFFFQMPVNLEDVIFSKERVRTYTHAEEDRERNIVSLEEAIEITDKEELRGLMLNVVRGDIQKSLSAISLALNSEDSETAHYAASVLQDALNHFRFNVQKQYLKLTQEKFQPDYAEAMLEYMNSVLEQRVFTELEQKTYVATMEEVAELLYVNSRESMTSSMFEAISLRLLETEDFEKCAKWCERAEYQYPNTLATYSCRLKLYFNSGQREKFFEVIRELKQSAVVIDSETLEMIRVFQ